MNVPVKLFPVILILLDLAAALVYFKNQNYRMAIYWLSAAAITVCVTF